MRKCVLWIVLLLGACGRESAAPPDRVRLAVGTWGGENAGVLVNDSVAHVHIGCTFGYLPAPVPLDASYHFSATGDYTLRAYPVQVGPSLPARYDGVIEGNKLTLVVTVNDTVEKKTVTVGPAVVYFGREPRMGPCPICRVTM